MLQDTKKKKKFDWPKEICFFFGLGGKDFIFHPAEGAAGGKSIGGRSDLLEIKAVEYGFLSITAQFVTKAGGFVWWLSCI